jgi:uncharacterized SAM-dependent methyltransferase
MVEKRLTLLSEVEISNMEIVLIFVALVVGLFLGVVVGYLLRTPKKPEISGILEAFDNGDSLVVGVDIREMPEILRDRETATFLVQKRSIM